MTPGERTAAPTLHDVARAAGVSLATASRVLNGSTRVVADSYRERVTAAAQRLGYSTNLQAQAVAKGSTAIVALVVADIADPYFAQLAAGVTREAERVGLTVTVSVTERDSSRELDLVRVLRGQRPRVLILAASRLVGDPFAADLQAELGAYAALGGTVAVLGDPASDYGFDLIDNAEGGRLLAERCLQLGYREFAAIVGPHTLVTSRDRLAGFTTGVMTGGGALPGERIVVTDFNRDGGYAAAHRLLARGLGSTELIFAANDVMAIGVMSALRDAGLEPGRDIAVCGFDDIPTARDVTPALTTVHLPLEELGALTLRRALGIAQTDASPAPGLELVVRASTPPRA